MIDGGVLCRVYFISGRATQPSYGNADAYRPIHCLGEYVAVGVHMKITHNTHEEFINSCILLAQGGIQFVADAGTFDITLTGGF
jgi:hypothetical protein